MSSISEINLPNLKAELGEDLIRPVKRRSIYRIASIEAGFDSERKRPSLGFRFSVLDLYSLSCFLLNNKYKVYTQRRTKKKQQQQQQQQNKRQLNLKPHLLLRSVACLLLWSRSFFSSCFPCACALLWLERVPSPSPSKFKEVEVVVTTTIRNSSVLFFLFWSSRVAAGLSLRLFSFLRSFFVS